MTKMRPSKSDLPKHLADAIRHAWPDGVVDMPVNPDEAPFWTMYPELKACLLGIERSAVLYEREPQGGPQWGEVSDPDEHSQDWNEGSRSYYQFFISLLGDRFQFDTDIIEPDEDGIERRFQGEGRIGCVAGISLVAPFAVVTLDQIEVFENESRSEPSIEPHIFSLDGRKLELEEHYREMVDDDGLMLLRQLRTQVVRILNDFGIAVIPEEELDKPVPWLRAGDEVFLGDTGESITVQQAFFFRGP